MPRVTFVGGPGDGMRKMLNETPYYFNVALMPKFDPFGTLSIQAGSHEIFRYKLEQIFGMYFYIDPAMKHDQLFAKLLAGYYPEEPR